jgi:hypothetical protein
VSFPYYDDTTAEIFRPANAKIRNRACNGIDPVIVPRALGPFGAQPHSWGFPRSGNRPAIYGG